MTQYVHDVEYLAKKSVVGLLGLPHDTEEAIRHEGRCSRRMEQVFIEMYGADNVMSVAEYKEMMQEESRVITCVTESV